MFHKRIFPHFHNLLALQLHNLSPISKPLLHFKFNNIHIDRILDRAL